jgi:hypothetical protein
MFSSFFRAMRQQQPDLVPQQDAAAADPPSWREILEHNNRCLDTYKQIIEMNKQMVADLKESTRMLSSLLPRPSQIRTCPNSHNLLLYTALGGNCDVCNRIVFVGEQVMDCRECNWYMCARCARNNGFTMPITTRRPRTAPQTFNTLFNDFLNPPATTAQSELYTFDIPLNGQGFDSFITQLTQTLNELAPLAQEDVPIRPTEAQINKACIVMPAIDANLSDQYVCPIDLSPIEHDESVMKIKHCGHVFRESNLRELFTRDVKCPMCRFDIRDHVEVTAGPNDGESEDDILDSPLGTFD